MNTKNPVRQSNRVLTPYSKRVVTLLDIMKELQVDKIYELRTIINGFASALKSGDRNSDLTKEEQAFLFRLRDRMNFDPFTKIGGEVAAQTFLLKSTLKTKSLHKFREYLIGNIEQLERAIFYSLSDTTFVGVDSANAKYFEQQHLFGEKVSAAFPVARGEIKDAGNCISVGLDTAAVFHLMRVVEYGLRELAIQLKVKKLITARGGVLKKTNTPIVYGTWEQIIKTLETRLAFLQNKPKKSLKRNQKIETCHELLQDFRAIKDLWRNKVMHARDSYTKERSIDAFNHVRKFMQRLAENSLNRARL
jgi:hypothetical protein